MMAARALTALALPLGALLAAYLAIPRLADVPPSLAGLKVYAPHITLALAMAVSIGFGRGRTLFALVALALAHAGARGYPGTALYHAITVALPLNLAVLSWRSENSAFNRRGLICAAVLAGEALALVALCAAFPGPSQAMLHQTFLAGLAFSPLTQLSAIAMALGVAAACAAWMYRRESVALALAAAIVAFGLSAHAAGQADTASLFLATAAAVLTIGVLQDVFRMAFRDALTGLGSRRALEEDLAGLGRRYVIAMVDVDHFKRVNDSHGHDTGDQVLRMVAGRLARARGARAYRYGGEEFALLFPNRVTGDVLQELEALREEIAGYPFRLRSSDRTTTGRRGRNRKPGAAKTLKVTVSMGVAQADARGSDAPAAVLAMADKALYRAKQRGRNMICR